MKKFPSLKRKYRNLLKNSRKNPKRHFYLALTAIRYGFAIASKDKRKSGGTRVITHLVLRMIPFTFSPFTTNRTLKTLPIKKLSNLLNLFHNKAPANRGFIVSLMQFWRVCFKLFYVFRKVCTIFIG